MRTPAEMQTVNERGKRSISAQRTGAARQTGPVPPLGKRGGRQFPAKASAISRALVEQIIPSIEKNGVSRVLLAKPHLEERDMPEGMSLTPRGQLGPAVRKRGPTLKIIARWPDDEMEAPRYPCLCFIYAGEADIPVGDGIVHCTAGSVILVPPGVPMTEGRGPHWCLPNPEKAHSDIFWIQLRPFGVECHVCHTRGLHHESGGFGKHQVVASRQLLPLVEQLIEELSQPQMFTSKVGGSYLLALCCLLYRNWSHEAAPDTEPAQQVNDLGRRDFENPQMAIQRAQQYIESNLGNRLTLQGIARAAYISRARLAQVFREQTGQTVWEYVTDRRLHEAKVMLAETDLNTVEIARLSGFPQPTHFFARFHEITGISPGEYRRNARSSAAGPAKS